MCVSVYFHWCWQKITCVGEGEGEVMHLYPLMLVLTPAPSYSPPPPNLHTHTHTASQTSWTSPLPPHAHPHMLTLLHPHPCPHPHPLTRKGWGWGWGCKYNFDSISLITGTFYMFLGLFWTGKVDAHNIHQTTGCNWFYISCSISSKSDNCNWSGLEFVQLQTGSPVFSSFCSWTWNL